MEPKALIETLRKAGMKIEAIRSAVFAAYEEAKAEEAFRSAFPEWKAETVKSEPVKDNSTEVRSIVEACELAGKPELTAEYLRNGKTIEQVRGELLEARRKAPAPIASAAKVEVTADERDKFRSKAVASICMRSGLSAKDIGIEEKEFRALESERVRGLSLIDMARESLEMSGVNTRLMPRDIIAERALGHSTSDFPYLLSTSAAKSMNKAYMETPASYQKWAGKGILVDFKTTDLVQMSGFSTLQEVPQGMPIKQITMSDAREQAALKTYGGVFTLSRQALINDDLGAFTRIPAGLASAARKKINTLVYGVLNDNANMADGTALFVGGHANLGSTAAISDTTITEAVKLMGLQTDLQSNYLNLFPAYMLVPKTKEGIALKYMTVMQGVVDTAAASSTYRGRMEVISDANLDASSTTAFYFAANPNEIDTVTVYFLNGQDAPNIREAEAVVGAPQGISYEVFIDVVAKAPDWRGLVKNAGA